MGIWNKLGTITYVPSTDDSGTLFGGTSNGDVLYDTNPQLISANADGKVFKMWFMVKSDYVYAEANNAQGPWTRKSPVLLANTGLGKIYKSGSTYYHYVVSPPSGNPTAVKAYTSPDGVTLTLQNATALIIGGVGAWDHINVQYLKPFYFDGTTYYATYSGTNASAVAGIGIATSTDLLHWTNASSPVFTGAGGPGPVFVGGKFYILTGSLPNPGVQPESIGIISSADRVTWSSIATILSPSQLNEGLGVPSSEGMGPTVAIDGPGGQSFLFYTGTNNALGTHYRQMAAVTNQPLATALATTGGQVTSYSVSTVVAASDNFTRANETPLSDGGAWGVANTTPGVFYWPVNLTSNKAVATNTGASNHALWNGPPSIGSDQYSEITVGTNSASALWVVGPQARETFNVNTLYQFGLNNDGSWQFRIIYTGTVVENLQSGAAGSCPTAIGTVLRLLISGNSLIVFVNGSSFTSAADSTIPTGVPSFQVYDGTTPANTGITLWSGGSSVAIPNFPPAASNYLIGSGNRWCTHGQGPQAIF